MVWGALLGLAGAGLGAYGANKQKHAIRDAQNQYRNDLNAFYSRADADRQAFGQQYQAIDQQRLGGIDQALRGYIATPYGQQSNDTANIDAALAQVHAEDHPQFTGAAAGWNAAQQGRNQQALASQRQIAGDAQMMARMGQDQSQALGEFNIQDQRLNRDLQGIRQAEALRQAILARQLQQLNLNAQATLDHAAGAGKDWINVGNLLGAGGGVIDNWSAMSGAANQGQQSQQNGRYNPNGGPIWRNNQSRTSVKVS